MRRISSLSRELSLARLIVRPAIREKEICGTLDVGWRPYPVANVLSLSRIGVLPGGIRKSGGAMVAI